MDKEVTGKGVVCCPPRLSIFSYLLYVVLAFDMWQTFYSAEMDSGLDLFGLGVLFFILIMIIVLFALSRKINRKPLDNPEKFLKGIKVYGFVVLGMIALRSLVGIILTILGLIEFSYYGISFGVGDFLSILAMVLEVVGILGFVLALCKGEVKMDEKKEATVKNENDYYKSSSFSSLIEDESELVEAEKALEQENNGE